MDNRMIVQAKAKEYKEKMIGKKYRHFKGNVYQILNIGVHSETEEMLVIYTSCVDTSLVWVRPLDMFLSEVDREKYPNVTQKYRFEEID